MRKESTQKKDKKPHGFPFFFIWQEFGWHDIRRGFLSWHRVDVFTFSFYFPVSEGDVDGLGGSGRNPFESAIFLFG